MTVPPSDDAAGRIDHLEREVRSLAERLGRAERQARRLRNILGLLVLVGVFTALAGRAFVAGSRNVVEAEWFKLRDADGNKRAALQITHDTPFLAFYDRNGKNILQILAQNDGAAGMQISDASGKVRLVVGHSLDHEMGLTAFDADGRKAASLTVARSGLASLIIFDRGGKMRINHGVRADDSAVMNILDPSGQERVALGGRGDGSMGLRVFDPGGEMRIDDGVRPDGSSGVAVYDREGRPMFQAPRP
jgi:hypothetical protein